jgi:heterodisulfide reductase subunit A-like polyferredoxin
MSNSCRYACIYQQEGLQSQGERYELISFFYNYITCGKTVSDLYRQGKERENLDRIKREAAEVDVTTGQPIKYSLVPMGSQNIALQCHLSSTISNPMRSVFRIGK